MSNDQANLGLATTAELLTELQARAEVGGYANYRTVDGHDALEAPVDISESPIVFMRGRGSHPPATEEKCGSFGCVLPKGHNMGRADIPENHAVPVSAGAGQVPADTISVIEREAEMILTLATGPWGRGEFTGEPSRLTVQVRHERFAQHATNILAALRRSCPECGRDLHGYRGPLCRYCDGTAE